MMRTVGAFLRASATLCFAAVFWAGASVAHAAPGCTPASAASVPADSTFIASRCSKAYSNGNTRLNDVTADATGNGDYRDIVGDATHPGLLYAEDSTYLWFRMRLGQTPAGTSNDCTTSQYTKQVAWGFLLDVDQNTSNYELMVIVDGKNDNEVRLQKNDAGINSPVDAPDTPALQNYCKFCRVAFTDSDANITAGDTYLSVAIPKTDFLSAVNLYKNPDLVSLDSLKFAMWGGTSSDGSALNDDVTCYASSQAGTDTLDLNGTVGTPIVIGTFVDITHFDNNQTTGTTPTISGYGEPGATITLSNDNDVNDSNVTTVDSLGRWSLTIPASWGLTAGSVSITAATNDPNGTDTDSESYTFTIVTCIATNTVDSTCNGVDEDCSGTADEDYGSSSTQCGTGACLRGGTQSCVSGVVTDSCVAGTPGTETVNDGVDSDCNGQELCYADADDDGYRPNISLTTGSNDLDCNDTFEATGNDPIGDCADSNSTINPGIAFDGCDGFDNDCSGAVDDEYVAGASCSTGRLGVCAAGTNVCSSGSVQCSQTTAAAATEVCDNADLDEDCDGLVEAADTNVTGLVTYYLDVDGDAFGVSTDSRSLCEVSGNYRATANGDCDDNATAIKPGATEVCNDIDDDCEGGIDEGIATTVYYRDADGDTFGNRDNNVSDCAQPSGYVASSTDCNDSNSTINTSGTEVCDSNNVDEDCDGLADNADASATGLLTFFLDADNDAYGVSGSTQSLCDASGNYRATVGNDCDDNATGVNPGAAEVCNDIDDNCAGGVDNNLPTETFYRDVDGDGYGDANSSVVDCAAPTGYVASSTDCNDGNNTISPAASEQCDGANTDEDCDGLADNADTNVTGLTTFFLDADNDAYGVTGSTQSLCDASGNYRATVGDDCDDNASAVRPNATEVCNDIDDDCEGGVDEGIATTVYYRDADGDSFGNVDNNVTDCSQPSGYVLTSTDCNDGNSSVSPAASEVCDASNVDEDCDGSADDLDSNVTSGQTTFYRDNDSDSYGASGVTQERCDAGGGYVADSSDCNDSNSSVSPVATELCNGVDDNCANGVDDNLTTFVFYFDDDGDGYGRADNNVTRCSAPAEYVANASDCNDDNASISPAAVEACDSADVDEDCDGAADDLDTNATGQVTFYRDADNDAYGSATVTQARCDAGGSYIANNTDCDDNRSATNPGASEDCNDIDDDCAAGVDNGLPTQVYYFDNDRDGFGDADNNVSDCSLPTNYVTDATDCNDGDAAVNTSATEACDGANVDEDCDGAADDLDINATGKTTFYQDGDSDGYGNASATQARCDVGGGYIADNTDCDDNRSATYPGASETCNDIDDNCRDGIDDNLTTQTFYFDDDGDGFGDLDTNITKCAAPTDFVSNASDCDDANASVSPSATEIIADNIDQDCNGGEICYADVDDDGYRADGNSTTVSSDADCDDANEAVGSDPTTDNCPTAANANQANTDRDAAGNACDPDDDNDGICDGANAVDNVCAAGPDSAPTDGSVCIDSDLDTCNDCELGPADPDNDGADRDQDGICDAGEDTDGDGVKDVDDLDDDGDGVSDKLENTGGIEPNGDADSDTIPNYLDASDRGDNTTAACRDSNTDGQCDELSELFDADEDEIANHLDLDSDNDGIVDVIESGLLGSAPDADDDGLADGAVGANGWLDALESAVDSGALKNALVLLDTDGDGTRDIFDTDSDGDTVKDLSEVPDLVDGDDNGDGRLDDRLDADRDGIFIVGDNNATAFGFPIADVRSEDDDNDSIPKPYDPVDRTIGGPGDSDDDGIADDVECAGKWPCKDSNLDGRPDYMDGDLDGDGLQNNVDQDDDNDGIRDTDEDAAANGDADGDGLKNRLELDSDNDGISDADEAGWGNLDANRDGRVDGLSGTDGIPNAAQGGADGGATGTPRNSDDDVDADFVDTDSDNDGVHDVYEAGDGSLSSPPQNTDGDNLADYRDPDDDGDGVDTRFENPDQSPVKDGNPSDAQDTDLTGGKDYLDDDDDGDGILTRNETAESNVDGNPIDALNTDQDGAKNYLDADDDGDGVPTALENPDPNDNDDLSDAQNTDGAGAPDYLDSDDDDDTVPTAQERPNPDSDNNLSKAQDTDKDTHPDYLDPDDDNDTVLTKDEKPAAGDPALAQDTDKDSAADYRDDDDDGDGIPTATEIAAENKLGRPGDNDQIAAYLDPDSDGDGVSDAAERGLDLDQDGIPDYLDPDVAAPDSDGDGMADATECPSAPCRDSDGDNILDFQDPDDDNDGVPTKDEVQFGNSDGDSDVDYLDADDDNDGVPTKQEGGTANTDGDLLADYRDKDDDDDGVPTSDELAFGNTDGDDSQDYLDADDDGDGVPSSEEFARGDSDKDGKPDARDTDDDGDDVPTAVERPLGDSDRDMRADYLDVDDDEDGVPTKDEVKSGDTDKDMKKDYLDTDDDGDGVPTSEELERGDSDDDGSDDYLDADDDGDGVPTSEEFPRGDTDRDGDENYLDVDDDGDKVPTKDEVKLGDTDKDKKPDYLDLDDDGDGLLTRDELPRGDTDKDKKPDYLDLDDDGDGIPTAIERTAGDTDGDGKPDYLDIDDDGDGIDTTEEPRDADGNGVDDRLEPGVEGSLGGGSCAVHTNGPLSGWSTLLGLAVAGVVLRRRRTRRAA